MNQYKVRFMAIYRAMHWYMGTGLSFVFYHVFEIPGALESYIIEIRHGMYNSTHL